MLKRITRHNGICDDEKVGGGGRKVRVESLQRAVTEVTAFQGKLIKKLIYTCMCKESV